PPPTRPTLYHRRSPLPPSPRPGSPPCCSLPFKSAPTPAIPTLSLHDALPISAWAGPSPPTTSTRVSCGGSWPAPAPRRRPCRDRSEEHTSELQSRFDLVCRLLLEKQKSAVRRTSRVRSAPQPPAPRRAKVTGA